MEDEQTMRETTLAERRKKQMSFTEKYQRRQNQEKLRNPGQLDCVFEYEIVFYKQSIDKDLDRHRKVFFFFFFFGNLILNTTFHILQLPLRKKRSHLLLIIFFCKF